MKNTSRTPYIYKVTNLETGQYYIGSQCSGKTIGVNYFTSSTNKAFKDGFKTYGEEKYKIEIIKKFEDPKECIRAENYIIRNHMQLKDGLCLNRFYCCSNKKIFSAVGLHHSEKAKQKMSKAQKGHRGWNKGLPSWNKGIHPSEETRKRISKANKGRPAWNKGIHPSEETRKRISKAQKGIHPAWNKGIPLAEKIKQKISISLQGHPSPRRMKISIDDIVFNSLVEASKYYNVSVPTISRWIKTKKHNAVQIEK